jgi:hypothetical protein
MSFAMRLLAPNLEEPTATDEWKVPSLVAEYIGSGQRHGQSNLNHLDFCSGIWFVWVEIGLWLDR